jgi:hypothetical protein
MPYHGKGKKVTTLPYMGKGKVTTLPYHGGKKKHHRKGKLHGRGPLMALAAAELIRRSPEIVSTLIAHGVDADIARALNERGVSKKHTNLAGDLITTLTGLQSRTR